MADPLLNHDALAVNPVSPSGAGLEDARARALSTTYEPPLEDPIRKGEMLSGNIQGASCNSVLNRTAEQIGGTLGKVVSQTRQLPESARKGLFVVKDRAQATTSQVGNHIASAASPIIESAQQRGRELASAAQERVSHFTDSAQQQLGEWKQVAQQRAGEVLDAAELRTRALLDQADALGRRVAERTEDIRAVIDDRTRELRAAAALNVEAARRRTQRAIDERPLQVLGAIAGASFILGVTLRIVRSRNASR